MTDFSRFLYSSYIKPYLDRQPRDLEAESLFSLWENSHTTQARQEHEALFRFLAVHAFYLGLRTGAGLARDCSAAGLECLTTRES